MKTIIAEKPSVAREIAGLLGASEKKEGYLTGNGYFVTWAFGHLIGLAMPEDYGISGFDKTALPIVPDPFLLTVRKVKKDKVYIADTGALKQLKIIEQLFNKSDQIIVATDAGREGELIFRHIYEHLKCTKPFKRLWISSLTEKAIKQGFDNLKDGNEFDGLYQAAKGRSRADWLVGINATQALSICAGNGIYSLGRVQTPTLAMICKRYLEHTNFEVQKYWQIEITHSKEFMSFKSLSSSKWQDHTKVQEVLKSIERNGKTNVSGVEQKKVTEQPPLLYDLTGLQKEANKKLNLSAAQTLDIAQSLYEKKFITYPRTGSNYIPQDLWEEVPLLLKALEVKPSCKAAVEKVKYIRLNKRIVNDLRVTDHHGLLVTEKIPTALSAEQEAVYNLIALRLIESVCSPCIKEITEVGLTALHYDFQLKSVKILEPGWRAISGNFVEEESEPLQTVPDLKIGDELAIKKIEILEKKTQAPKLYTDAGILSAMESAGRNIENELERKALKEIGIGTPATRAAIIETLFSRQYITNEKKSLIPTDKGLQVYELVKDQQIADVQMTAQWEIALQQIENRELDAVDFQRQMEDYARLITKELLEVQLNGENSLQLSCPKCKSAPLILWEKIVKCPNENCGWLQYRNVCGKYLDTGDIKNLVCNARTSLIKGFKSKTGKSFDAYIVLDDNGKTFFEFPPSKTNRNSKRK